MLFDPFYSLDKFNEAGKLHIRSDLQNLRVFNKLLILRFLLQTANQISSTRGMIFRFEMIINLFEHDHLEAAVLLLLQQYCTKLEYRGRCYFELNDPFECCT